MPRRDFNWIVVVGVLALACRSGAPPDAGTPTPIPQSTPQPRVETAQQRWEDLMEVVRAVAELRTTFETLPQTIESFDARLEACEALGDSIGELWAATRRAAILEAKKRAVPRDSERIEPASRRAEDDLLVNFRTEGYAELAALAYRLRWGGWREAGSEETLHHLLSTTGIPLVAIGASCDPRTLELTASADCHTKAALEASLVGIEHCL